MQTKRKTFTLGAVVIVLLLTITMASVAVATDGGLQVSNPKIVREVTTTLSEIDKDWPIVRIERTEEFDNETDTRYVTVLIVRQSPANFVSLNDDVACVDSTTLANCVKTNVKSYYETGQRSSATGWITSHVKHLTDIICYGIDCFYRKPTMLETWWTRSGPNWRATSAYAGWGCYGCAICGGGSWQYVWIQNPNFTPSWQNNTKSYIYVYNSTSYPGLFPWDFSTSRASMDSDAYEGWTFRGHMSVNPGFNP